MLSQKKYDEIFNYYQKGVYDNIDNFVAFGDIHGDYSAFINVLRKANIIDNNENWIAGKMHVIQMGDVLDRKSRFDYSSDEDSEFRIIGLILKLQIDSYLAGGGFHPIIGNHELMNIMGIFDYVSQKGINHFRSLEDRKRYFKIGGDFCRYLASGWNVVIKINKFLFCHGGINSEIANKYSIERINLIMRDTLYHKEINMKKKEFDELFLNERSILWSRNFSDNIEENNLLYSQLMLVLKKYKCEFMVLGHTPYFNGIKIKFNNHVICLDTGMSKAFGEKNKENDRIHYLLFTNNKIKLF